MTIFRNIGGLTLAGSMLLMLAGCGGDGGGGGSSGPEAPRSITLLSDTTTTLANDLRGLTYAGNGKIYASGHSDADSADRASVIARFNADGTLDTSFDTEGVLNFNVVEGGPEESVGIVELANGDVVVAVSASDLNGGEVLTSVIDPSITAPRASGTSIFLLRFTSTGAPVTSFGIDGRAEVTLGWDTADNDLWPVPSVIPPVPPATSISFSHAGFPTDTVQDLKLDPSSSGANERIVLFAIGSAPRVGMGIQRVDNDRYVVRILAATGALDPSFNGGEPFQFNTPPTFADNARRGVVEEDGSILSAGYTNLGTGRGNHVVLLALTPSGEFDAAFGNFMTPTVPMDPVLAVVEPGVAIFNPYVVDGGNIEAYAAVRQSSGNYVTSGYGRATDPGMPTATPPIPPRESTLGFLPNVAQDLMSARVVGAGVDAGYGSGGNVAIQSESLGRASAEDRGRDLVVLADDRTVHVGNYSGMPAIFVLTADGALDTSVDTDGIFELPGTVAAQFFNAALSPDGQQVAATTTTDANGARLVIVGER